MKNDCQDFQTVHIANIESEYPFPKDTMLICNQYSHVRRGGGVHGSFLIGASL